MKTFLFSVALLGAVMGGPLGGHAQGTALDIQQSISDRNPGLDVVNTNRSLTDRTRPDTGRIREKAGEPLAPRPDEPATRTRVVSTPNRALQKRVQRLQDTKSSAVDNQVQKRKAAQKLAQPSNNDIMALDGAPPRSSAPKTPMLSDEKLRTEESARWDRTEQGKTLKKLERESTRVVTRTSGPEEPLLAPPPR